MDDKLDTPRSFDCSDVFGAITDPVISFDMDGRIVSANSAAVLTLGFSLEELRGRTCHDVCGCEPAHGGSSGVHRCFMRDVLGRGRVYRDESVSLVNFAGGEIKTRVTASPVIKDGEIVGGVQVFRVATEEGAVVSRLRELAAQDELTGLANRRELSRRMGIELARARRHRRPMAILMMDLDHFKDYNDAHGHLAGDEALRLLGRVLREHSRVDDIAARYGGEEFVLILPETVLENARLIAERVRRALAESEIISPPVTCSIGVYAWTGEGEMDSQTLLARADSALYDAKHRGRNRVEVFPGSGAGGAGDEPRREWR